MCESDVMELKAGLLMRHIRRFRSCVFSEKWALDQLLSPFYMNKSLYNTLKERKILKKLNRSPLKLFYQMCGVKRTYIYSVFMAGKYSSEHFSTNNNDSSAMWCLSPHITVAHSQGSAKRWWIFHAADRNICRLWPETFFQRSPSFQRVQKIYSIV